MTMRSAASALVTAVALVLATEGVALAAMNTETSVPDGCVKVLRRDGNYVCCGGPVLWRCTRIPSKIPGRVISQ